MDPDGSTACAFVAYDHDGDRRYLFHWDDTPATKAVMPDVTAPELKEAKYFHVMGRALTAKLKLWLGDCEDGKGDAGAGNEDKL